MGKKNKSRNFSTKKNQFKQISRTKTAAVFDEKERKEYLTGMFGAKQKRKEEYIKLRNEKHKKFNKEQKAQIREEKKKQIERLQNLIDFNNSLSKTQKTESIKTSNNKEVEVTTTFFQ
ncbi:unnamed protein product [Paramecium octaurelia]|uniref:Nucleolar protein 12 n=1 Tax=Paramecium octaurelia TaxID=43137 RepID=A0A8S1YGM6_PAROT|nr:unnamed protein product [Paramecium octaurelia]